MTGSVPLDHAIARIRARDAEAFSAVVEAYDLELVKLAYVISGDAEIARDAAQDTWHFLWASPPGLRDANALRGWLLKVTANNARQTLRRRRIRDRVLSTFSRPRELAIGDSDNRADLGRALAKIPLSDRELLALRYVLDLSSVEIGGHLNLSPEGVRSRLRRIIAKLRKELREH